MTQQQLESLLTNATPFIDVRAPTEFATGTLPGAMNLPLLNDRERHEVGITHKHKGAAAAVQRGESLVSGAVKNERIESWLSAVAAHHSDLFDVGPARLYDRIRNHGPG